MYEGTKIRRHCCSFLLSVLLLHYSRFVIETDVVQAIEYNLSCKHGLCSVQATA